MASQADTKHSPWKKVFIGAICAYILFFLFVAFSRHDNFYSRRLDLGNMDQTVWNVLHGNGFTLTDPMGQAQESRLAVHADFLLILLAPFYLLWSNPKMLVLIQTIVLGLGAIPIYWLGKEKLKSEKLAAVFGISYLLYPPSQLIALHDFHAVTLSTTFLLFAFWYMRKLDISKFTVFALLAALGKEQVWVIVGMMALYFVRTKRHRWFGLFAFLVSGFIFWLIMWVLIPKVSYNQQHWALIYLSEFGSSQNDIFRNILTNPFVVLRDLFAPDRLFYYVQLFFPVGFLSLLSPVNLVLALPSILINSLSNNALMRIIDYQYTSTITPWVFISAIEGYIVLQKLLPKKVRVVAIGRKILPTALVLLLACTFVGSYLWGELPLEKKSRFAFFTSTPKELPSMKLAEKEVDSEYTVSASNNIGAHFSQREYLYNFPVNAQKVDYAIILLGDPYAWPSGDEQAKMVNTLARDENYEIATHSGRFYMFRRKGLTP